MARTHSEYSWDELMSEALGEMGLHPWEFFRYSFKEFVCKRKGHYERDIREWHRARFIAFYAASGNLRKGTKITDLLSLPGDKNYKGGRKLSLEQIKRNREILINTKPPEPVNRNGKSGA